MLAQPTANTNPAPPTLLRPAAVFDGQEQHPGWAVLVKTNKLRPWAGGSARVPAGARTLDLPGLTLLPGLIEGHSHLLLHPYNETPWNDQVLLESQALRVARATVHAQRTLLAGFTTTRDLGSEGAGFADVGLKQAINQGIIPGPRLLVATRALVATGSYGPSCRWMRTCPRARRKPMAWTASSGPCASKSARAPTSLKYTPTTAGEPMARPSPRFRRKSSR